MTSIFQRLAAVCLHRCSTTRAPGGEVISPQQLAEQQLQQLTGRDLKGEAEREAHLGFLRLHFGTTFLVGNWMLFSGCAIYAVWVALQFRSRCHSHVTCAWAGAELLGAMFFAGGGLALLQSAYPQRLRQFYLIMMQPPRSRTDLVRTYFNGTWVVLGNALWALASVVWLLGSTELLVGQLLTAPSPFQGSCETALGALPLVELPLPCDTLFAIVPFLGYLVQATFFTFGWFISLEDNLRANGGQGSSLCWDCCCTSLCCRDSPYCQAVWSVDMTTWAVLFQVGVLLFEAIASIGLAFNLSSLTAWFIFSAATMLSGGFLVMIHAQEKMIKQMSY
ncbi:hypothetical protein AB1Y20_006142 [Prymnesium parvum]|uniref:Uncharacterized protein n=1 Tax=Prymnesium parvum TaxID=97485 RepID=A0AB34J1V5_PRYPA|mmetsp:Transcript_740/g.1927  ORF Transcript_740/g.1927 Transcript_740/m.1927 type:complete len:335 (+) Transcript_740:1-1005(+)